jgi:anti-sigma B factor antagonist
MATITERDRGRVTILDVTGEITAGAGDEQLRQAAVMAVSGGASIILLNLKGGTAMDAAGIDGLFDCHLYADQRGADVKLASVPPKVKDLPQFAEVTTIFEIYKTEDEAVAAHS